jgi:hypothetical protein
MSIISAELTFDDVEKNGVSFGVGGGTGVVA